MVSPRCLSLGLLAGALVLAACSPARPVVPVEGPTSQPSSANPTIELAAAPSLESYSNPDFGYSLSYPAGYELESSFAHSVLFLAPPETPGHRERGWLTVQFSSEEDARWYADQAKQENSNLGTPITSSTQVLDGRQAYVLGRLPGQDLNRQVFVVDNGALYHLTFMPDDPGSGEEYQQMEALYAAILGSLRFLPDRQAVPPLIDISSMLHELEKALNARSATDLARLLGNEFVLGELDPGTPEGVTHERYTSAEIIPMILGEQLSPSPAISLLYKVDWASVTGSLDSYSWFFPGEVVTPILAKGWGPNGADQAVVIIGRNIDGSLLWRGVFVLKDASSP